MANPGRDDANIGNETSYREVDMSLLVDWASQHLPPDHPVVYTFGRNRPFVELEPYDADDMADSLEQGE